MPIEFEGDRGSDEESDKLERERHGSEVSGHAEQKPAEQKPIDQKPATESGSVEQPSEQRPLPADVESAIGGALGLIREAMAEAIPRTEVILEAAETAPEAGPGKTAADYFEEGKSLAKAKDYDKAIQSFTHAIEYNIGEDEYYFWRAACHHYKGDVDQAISDLNMALAINPGNKDYRQNYDACVEEQNEKKAQEESAAVLKTEAAPEQSAVEGQASPAHAPVEGQASPAQVPIESSATPASEVPASVPAEENAGSKERLVEQTILTPEARGATPGVAAPVADPTPIEAASASATPEVKPEVRSTPPTATSIPETAPDRIMGDGKPRAGDTSTNAVDSASAEVKHAPEPQGAETKGLYIRKELILVNDGTAKVPHEGEKMSDDVKNDVGPQVDPTTLAAAQDAAQGAVPSSPAPQIVSSESIPQPTAQPEAGKAPVTPQLATSTPSPSQADERGKDRVNHPDVGLPEVPKFIELDEVKVPTRTLQDRARREIAISLKNELNDMLKLNNADAAEKKEKALDTSERERISARQRAIIYGENLAAEARNDPIIKAFANLLQFNGDDKVLEEQKGIIEKARQKKAELEQKKAELNERLAKEYTEIEKRCKEQCETIEKERQNEESKIKEAHDLELAKRLNKQEAVWKEEARRKAAAPVVPAATPEPAKEEVAASWLRPISWLPRKQAAPAAPVAQVQPIPAATPAAQPTPAPAAEPAPAQPKEPAGPGLLRRGAKAAWEKTKAGANATWKKTKAFGTWCSEAKLENGIKAVGTGIGIGVSAVGTGIGAGAKRLWTNKYLHYLTLSVAVAAAGYASNSYYDWSAKAKDKSIIRPANVQKAEPAVPVAAVDKDTSTLTVDKSTSAPQGNIGIIETADGTRIVYTAPGQTPGQADAGQADAPKPRERHKGRKAKKGPVGEGAFGVNGSSTTANVAVSSAAAAGSTDTAKAAADFAAAMSAEGVSPIIREVVMALENGTPLRDDRRILKAKDDRVCINMGDRRTADNTMKILNKAWGEKSDSKVACAPGGQTCVEKPSVFGRRLCAQKRGAGTGYTGKRPQAAARNQ